MHINPGTYKTFLAPKKITQKGGGRWAGKEKQPQEPPKLYQTHAAGKYFQSESTKSENEARKGLRTRAPVESGGKCQKSFCLS